MDPHSLAQTIIISLIREGFLDPFHKLSAYATSQIFPTGADILRKFGFPGVGTC
jgi:hypothetical protein